jgi:putative spermidine/putrescine transport system substrate-binding protein
MNFELGRRGVMAGAAGALAATSPFGAAQAQGAPLIINTYGASWEKFWRETLVPGFEKASGLKAVVEVGLGRTWISNLRAAGVDKPPYSAIMMNEVWASVVRPEGFFTSWPVDQVPNLRKVAKEAKNADNSMVFAMVSPIGLGYRTDLVKNKPTSWKDLWDNPEFKGKIGLYQIANSAGVMFLMLAGKIYGKGPFDWDAGFAQVEKLKPFPQVDLSGALVQLLTRGEVAIAPIDVAEIIRLKRRGVPVDFVVPNEGFFQFDQSICLLKNGPNKDAAYKWLDYLLSDDVQLKLAEEFFVTPTNTNVKLPEALRKEGLLDPSELSKTITWDWVRYTAERDQVVDRWNRVMR